MELNLYVVRIGSTLISVNSTVWLVSEACEYLPCKCVKHFRILVELNAAQNLMN
jgi:hypothetical protein